MGRPVPWRDAIQLDLAAGLGLADALRTETPLMRYLKRVLTEIDPENDVVAVLRHPEDAQQANDQLLGVSYGARFVRWRRSRVEGHDAKSLFRRGAA